MYNKIDNEKKITLRTVSRDKIAERGKMDTPA